MKLLALCLAFCSVSVALSAKPAQVLLIRHAEKPDTGDGLSQKGFQRTAALVPFFTQRPSDAPYGVPVVIYAQPSSKNHASTRPVQTVGPLANYLGIQLICTYTYAETQQMVDEINNTEAYDGETVLICWSHQKMGDIAAAFGVSPKPVYPSGGVYDRLWVINFDSKGNASFQNLSQQLMYGDSKN